MVVFEAAVAAVWRIGEGLVGGGVFFLLVTSEEGSLEMNVNGLPGCFGTAAFGLGFERAVAAVFNAIVGGPLVDVAFFRCDVDFDSNNAIVFSYFLSAFFLASIESLHSSPGHSGKCIHGIGPLS